MSDEHDEISLSVSKEMDIEGTHFLYKQRTEVSTKILDYDYKRCTGCGLCIDICPTQALELGPMHEIATGMDAPPVMMDLDKCTFCSMCANFCPVNAFKMNSEGIFPEEGMFPTFDSSVDLNDKCLPCRLCEAACPEDAIKVDFTFPKKEDIAPFKENVDGEIEIDDDKCNRCGICADLCDAFIIVEKETSPTNPIPFEQVMIDEDLCDYCVLCQDICPEDAIRVRGEKRGEAPEIQGKVIIDSKKCTLCGWCNVVCPYDAVDLKKPFDGEIFLVEANIDKCDPQGCHGCFNVCPSHMWYVPKDGKKIAMREDLCTYCGACVNACHVDVMRVDRTKVNHTHIPESPWANQWKEGIRSMLTGERTYPDLSRTLEVKQEGPREHMDIQFPEFDSSLMEAAAGHIDEVRSVFKSIKLRKMLVTEPSDVVRRAVKDKRSRIVEQGTSK
ncbi:MAG: 4Fe-4S binding protein [Euryarchaeota archaeon]|nr:4Fe-4S binding protein [Euryarchaeota archaeon]